MQNKQNKLYQAIIANALEKIQEKNPIENQQEIIYASQKYQSTNEQINEINQKLAEKINITNQLNNIKKITEISIVLLSIITAISAITIIKSILANGQNINLIAAFITILGINTIAIIIWLINIPENNKQTIFTKIIITINQKLIKSENSREIINAITQTIKQNKLTSWITGIISHAIWTGAYILITIALTFGFSFYTYTLNWESTILKPETFGQIIKTSSIIPQKLNLATPSEQTIKNFEQGINTKETQKEMALWLIIVTIIYGLIPRGILCLISYYKYKTNINKIKLPNMANPANQILLQKLNSIKLETNIIDKDGQIKQEIKKITTKPLTKSGGIIIHYELQNKINEENTIKTNGSAKQNDDTLMQVVAKSPAKLLIITNQAHTPDRGIARFINMVAQIPNETAIHPYNENENNETNNTIWENWANQNLDEVIFIKEKQTAKEWIENA